MTLVDDEIHLHSQRHSPEEVVEVRFADLFQVSAYALSDEHDRDVIGSEDDLRQRILEQPTLIEEAFTPARPNAKRVLGQSTSMALMLLGHP